jgi:hypothetical protein
MFGKKLPHSFAPARIKHAVTDGRMSFPDGVERLYRLPSPDDVVDVQYRVEVYDRQLTGGAPQGGPNRYSYFWVNATEILNQLTPSQLANAAASQAIPVMRGAQLLQRLAKPRLVSMSLFTDSVLIEMPQVNDPPRSSLCKEMFHALDHLNRVTRSQVTHFAPTPGQAVHGVINDVLTYGEGRNLPLQTAAPREALTKLYLDLCLELRLHQGVSALSRQYWAKEVRSVKFERFTPLELCQAFAADVFGPVRAIQLVHQFPNPQLAYDWLFFKAVQFVLKSERMIPQPSLARELELELARLKGARPYLRYSKGTSIDADELGGEG